MIADRPPFARGALDRDAATRMNPNRLRAAWQEPGARLLRLRGVEIPVRRESGAVRLALLPIPDDEEPARRGGDWGPVFLGRVGGDPVFARPEDAATAPPDADAETDARCSSNDARPGDCRDARDSRAARDSRDARDEEWLHPFEAGPALSECERELVGVASALLRWHEDAAFSPRDGSATTLEYGGWARRDAHGAELFPRTDPAVIVLIEHEDRALLGSNALWESGRFSLLAGFVEAGESLEQAVAREVHEESGVRLGEIEYVTSQPWPFPRSLMLGFRARLAPGVDPDDLRPDPEEISELRWFSRAELREPAPGITLPMPLSIARWLIDRWVAEGDAGDA
ncbi:NAD(+) diphosphatase [Leucobacter triazinivorans]|uniref:NAD(+) diphosphatase n=1 Tax=Leucobacter triazinivorans TaxID=1784719 RepID=A0A4P6KCC8_9MICO|nr:NAD(+) diphosphatase [Leucobacter triazinivorans]QBE47763.1 NAD(+) diphosphatase [Leucobacter triazinivorans]